MKRDLKIRFFAGFLCLLLCYSKAYAEPNDPVKTIKLQKKGCDFIKIDPLTFEKGTTTVKLKLLAERNKDFQITAFTVGGKSIPVGDPIPVTKNYEFSLSKEDYFPGNTPVVAINYTIAGCIAGKSIEIKLEEPSTLTVAPANASKTETIVIESNGCDFKFLNTEFKESTDTLILKFLSNNYTAVTINAITVAGTSIQVPQAVSNEINIVLSKLYLNSSTDLIIKLTLGDCKEITQILSKKIVDPSKPAAPDDKPCPFGTESTLLSAECNLKTPDNNFLEDIRYYDDDKVVYIYDFNYGNQTNAKISEDGKTIPEFFKVQKVWDSKCKYQKFEKDKKKTEKRIRELEIRKQVSASGWDKYEKDRIKKRNTAAASKIEEMNFKLKLINARMKLYEPRLNITVANFNKEMLHPDQNIKFKILHINRFIYDVSLSDTLVEFDSQPSALFRQMFIGDSAGVLGTLLGNFSTALGTSVKADGQTHSAVNMMTDPLYSEVECFIRGINSMRTKVEQAYNSCSSFPCCQSFEYNELANKLTHIKAVLASRESAFNALKKDLASSKDRSNACKKTNKDTLATGKMLRKLNEAIKTETVAAKKTIITDSISKMKEIFTNQTNNTCKQKYIDSIDTRIKSLIVEMEPYHYLDDLSSALPLEDELRKLTVFINNMTEQNQTYSTDFINLRGNRLDLLLQIGKKDQVIKDFPQPDDKRKYDPIEIPIINNAFVSFSSGFFISPGNNLQNKRYQWQELPVNNTITAGSSSYILVESAYTPPPWGFAALGNFEKKLSRNIGLGGSIGVGLPLESSTRPVYLAGGSLLLGDMRQFALTIGFAFMQVEKIKKNLQTISDKSVIYNTNTTPIEYYKELKIGSFVSVTYTPFRISKRHRNKK